MPTIRIPANGWRPRPYQRPVWDYLERGGKRAITIWHRRAGKDEVFLHRACIAAHERPGNYWHMLPEYTQARKAVWEAINPHTGRRRIDEVFPIELRETTRDHEMIIKLKVGSTWQLVGSDNFNSLMGSPPVGVVFSEYSISNPSAWGYIRPIMLENDGWAAFNGTPRGHNHAERMYKSLKLESDSFAQLLTVDDTKIFSPDMLARERREMIREYGADYGDALYRQEYECSFDAANLGAIMGKAIEIAEREGRIHDDVTIDPQGAPLEISSDIGLFDTCTWWFWQPRMDGYALVDYDQDSGMDAQEWMDRLDKKGYDIAKIWLPQDAKARTMATKRSVAVQFVERYGGGIVKVVPPVTKHDRINAARSIAAKCEWNRTKCELGLDGLRAWAYEYNEETKTFSKEPLHDWASHPGDGFSYGAVIMRERVIEPKPKERDAIIHDFVTARPTLDELWDTQPRKSARI